MTVMVIGIIISNGKDMVVVVVITRKCANE